MQKREEKTWKKEIPELTSERPDVGPHKERSVSEITAGCRNEPREGDWEGFVP